MQLLLLLLLLVFSGYWYFTQHAESIFSRFVRYETKGTVELDIKKLRVDFNELRLTLIETRLYSVDTINSPSSYDIKADTIILELAELRPLFFGRQLKVDSILIKKPQIHVVRRIKADQDTFNLPQQMDVAYRSLNKALNQFSVKYCLVDSGRFKLTDRTIPNSQPLVITDYYLMIDHMQKDNADGQRFLFADKVKFYSSKQMLTSLDGKHQLHYSRLRINSYRKLIELDSCYIFSQPAPGSFNKFSGFFDTLRFANVDFVHLVEQNTLLADSVYCINPKVEISSLVGVNNNPSGKMKMLKNKDSLVATVKKLMGNFRLKYISVDNGSVSMMTKKGEKTSSYFLQKSDFVLQDVVVVDRPDIPLQIGRFDLGLMGYQAIDPDSIYIVKFDSVRLLNDHVYLSNFSLKPYLNNKQGNEIRQLHARALQINDVEWDELFASRKIVAASVELIQPQVLLEGYDNNKRTKPSKNIFKLFHAIAPFASVNTLFIRDANIGIQNNGHQTVGFKGLYAELKVNAFLQSATLEDLGKSIKDISFHQAFMRIKSGQLILNDGYIRGSDKMLWMKKLNLEKDDGNVIYTFENLSVNELESFSKGKIVAGDLHWKKAFLTAASQKKKKSTASATAPMEITIKHIGGDNTLLNIDNNEQSMSSSISSVDVSGFNWNTADVPIFSALSLKGDYFKYKKNATRMTMNSFDIHSNAISQMKEVNLVLPAKKGMLNLFVPEFKCMPLLNEFNPMPLQLNNCEISSPILNWEKSNTFQRHTPPGKISFPAITINHLTITNPSLKIKEERAINHLMTENLQLDLNIHQIKSIPDSGAFIKGVVMSANNFTYQTEGKKIAVADTGKLSIKVSSIQLQDVNEKEMPMLSADIDAVDIKGLNMVDSVNKKGNSVFQLHSLKLKSLFLNDLLNIPIKKSMADAELQIDSTSFSLLNAASSFSLVNLHTESRKSLAFDTMTYHPTDSIEAYLKKYGYQKDYLIFNAGNTRICGVDQKKLIMDQSLMADSIIMNQARLYVFKDKRWPFLKGVSKQLPVGLIQKIPVSFQVEKSTLNNAMIDYEELNDKNGKVGNVEFSNLQIALTGVKNIQMKEGDSLRLQASGNFMGKAFMRFRYAQSYADTIGGFSLGIRFRPFELRQLNKVLEPLAGASVISGSLDTIRLNAIGSDSIAHGKMKMYYKGLKIRYTGLGSDSVRNFKSRIITFLANDFILKRNNSNGYGVVYTKRDKERSFASYWLRIGLSGVMSSSGVKSNKKQEKQYRQQIEKMKIPDLPDIGL